MPALFDEEFEDVARKQRNKTRDGCRRRESTSHDEKQHTVATETRDEA